MLPGRHGTGTSAPRGKRRHSSPEPKALSTSAIVAAALEVPIQPVEGLREFDRPPLPIMSPEEHQRVNAEIFSAPDRAVLGSESAHAALARFSSALLAEISAIPSGNLVAVSHGTVISLFVAKYNDVDPFTIWRALACASFAVLELPSFGLLRLSADAGQAPLCEQIRVRGEEHRAQGGRSRPEHGV
jgi:broad specificity phosphatase PhoE